jgi:HAD superfamily hydrolase (TIGR01509 family)
VAEHARCGQKLIRERFRHDDTAYKRHERGEIGSEEFFDNLRASLAIDISDAQLLDGWNSILIGEMPVVSKLLAKAAGSFPLYAFTNSNREHEQYWSKQFSGILSNFKEVYVSSTIGLRKPEAEAYDYVVRAIGVSADRIVFFDDSRVSDAAASLICSLTAPGGWSNPGLVSDGEQTLLVDTLFDLPQMLKTMISSTARQRVRVKAVTTLTSGHRLRPQRIEAKRNAM